MRGHSSLRSRILAAFVIAGAVMGPLLAGALLAFTYKLEERAVARIASARLEEVIRRPEDFALREVAPGVRVLTNFSTAAFPAQMFALPDGVHEYETDEDAWFVALRTTASGRYAVVEDITALERRERLTVLAVVAATLLAILLALMLGARLSRRLVAPLVQLSERVAGADPLADPTPPARHYPDREVATLAAALDLYASRMRQSLQREREFSADVSHELRNPLAVIQNAAELIEEDAAASDLTRRAAGRIKEAAQHLTETVAVLLILVREKRTPLLEENVSVAECLQALRSRLPVPAAGAPALEWRSQAEPVVRAPRAVVEAVAGNLIRNAQEHSVGKRIEVRLEDDRLVVEDDGVGISGARTAPPGRGMGLSLVQRLCTRFNWVLHIDSRPGEGTRVEWRFGTT